MEGFHQLRNLPHELGIQVSSRIQGKTGSSNAHLVPKEPSDKGERSGTREALPAGQSLEIE